MREISKYTIKYATAKQRAVAERLLITTGQSADRRWLDSLSARNIHKLISALKARSQ